jgi:hypothetical protein
MKSSLPVFYANDRIANLYGVLTEAAEITKRESKETSEDSVLPKYKPRKVERAGNLGDFDLNGVE